MYYFVDSILLGRVLRGQPQVRKALLLYVAALHVYIIFGCLLSMLWWNHSRTSLVMCSPSCWC